MYTLVGVNQGNERVLEASSRLFEQGQGRGCRYVGTIRNKASDVSIVTFTPNESGRISQVNRLGFITKVGYADIIELYLLSTSLIFLSTYTNTDFIYFIYTI